MRRFFALALLLFAGAVFAQAPAATTYTANLTWTLPAGCTAAASCTVTLYRWDGACPATGAPTGALTILLATAVNPVSYADASVAGGTSYCYAAETVQGAAHSGPSNYFTLAVPGTPPPPGTLGGTVVTIVVTVTP